MSHSVVEELADKCINEFGTAVISKVADTFFYSIKFQFHILKQIFDETNPLSDNTFRKLETEMKQSTALISELYKVSLNPKLLASYNSLEQVRRFQNAASDGGSDYPWTDQLNALKEQNAEMKKHHLKCRSSNGGKPAHSQELREHKQQLKKAYELLVKRDDDICKLKKEVTELKEQTSSIQLNNADLVKQLNSAKALLAKSEDENENYKSQVKKQSEEIERLKKENGLFQDICSDAKEQIDTVDKQSNERKSELKVDAQSKYDSQPEADAQTTPKVSSPSVTSGNSKTVPFEKYHQLVQDYDRLKAKSKELKLELKQSRDELMGELKRRVESETKSREHLASLLQANICKESPHSQDHFDDEEDGLTHEAKKGKVFKRQLDVSGNDLNGRKSQPDSKKTKYESPRHN